MGIKGARIGTENNKERPKVVLSTWAFLLNSAAPLLSGGTVDHTIELGYDRQPLVVEAVFFNT